MDTLFLNPDTWDLVVDAHNNIAVAANPYALAQDAASEIKTFSSECYYDTAKGIPYFEQILGHAPPPSLMKQYWVSAALLTPEWWPQRPSSRHG